LGQTFLTCLEEESKATKVHPVCKPTLETRPFGINGKNAKHANSSFFL